MDSLPGNGEGSFGDSSDYRNSAAHVHSFFNHDLHRSRHGQIRPRAKLNHSKTLATFYPVAAPLPTNNPSRQNPGDLRALNSDPLSANCERILLVQQPRLVARGHQEFAAFMGDFRDFASN